MPKGNSSSAPRAEDTTKLKKKIIKFIEGANGKKVGLKNFIRPLLVEYPNLAKRVSRPVTKNGIHTFELKLLLDLCGVPTSQPCLTCGKPTKFNWDYSVPRQFCGCRCSTLNKEVLAKTQARCLDRYGTIYPMRSLAVRTKFRQTCMDRHGVDHPLKSIRVQRKSQNTCKRNHGVRFPLQDPSIFRGVQSESFNKKTFTAKTGESFPCMGYEPIVLERLYNDPRVVVMSTDCGCKLLPMVRYTNPRRGESSYFPDIGIRTTDGRELVIEVKSFYTLCGSPEKAKLNKLKFRAASEQCSSQGKEFWLALVKGNGITWIRNGDPRRWPRGLETAAF